MRFEIMKLRFPTTLPALNLCRNRSAKLMVVLACLTSCDRLDIPNPMDTINEVIGANYPNDDSVVFGVVVGDDPNAVNVGNSIIRRGGSAADAAVAMGFAMSVTYPSKVGLGGGGVCLAGGGRKGNIQALDFLPTAANSKGPHTDRPTAIPTMVRGLAAMHARYGKLSWSEIISPARAFARDGFIITKSFKKELEIFKLPLFADPISRKIFSKLNFKPIDASNRFRQIDLNTVLSTIIGRGAGEFYTGNLARRLVHATKRAGGSLGAEELRRYLPKWRDAVSVKIGENVFYTPPPPTSGGIVAITMHQLAVVGREDIEDKPEAEAHLLVEVAKRSLALRSRWMKGGFRTFAQNRTILTKENAVQLMRSFTPRSATPVEKVTDISQQETELNSRTSFIVADPEGLVVSCDLTMYHPFGIGRTAPGLGILLSPAPDKRGRNPMSLGPIMVASVRDNSVRLAFSSSHGATSGTAMANVLYKIFEGKETLKSAIGSPRFHYGITTGEVTIEFEKNGKNRNNLVSKGHKVREVSTIGRVNAILCRHNLQSLKRVCEGVADPRGEGLAANINYKKRVH